jgi:hypothetical protein
MTIRIYFHRSMLLILFVGFHTADSAHAEASEASTLSKPALVRALHSGCEQLLRQLTTQKEFAPVFAARPIQNEAVCKCAEAKFTADQRISKYWARSEPEQKQAFLSESLKAYTATRVVTAIMECMIPEFNLSLESTDLP